MFTCDPILLVLLVVLIVFLALILREFAVRNGLLVGQKLFEGAGKVGACDGVCGGNDSGDFSIADLMN